MVRVIRAGICLAAVGTLAACTSSKPKTVVTVTVPPGSSSASSAATGSSSPATTSSPAASTTPPSPTATAPHQSQLNGTCDTLLPNYAVLKAIGATSFSGHDAFVVGKPDPSIGRLAYLNCRYDVTGTGSAAKPGIEIGISLYSSEATAAQRITATVDDYSAHGASAADTSVNGQPATMLTGGIGPGYDVPLLVVASGQRTVAVSVDASIATGTRAQSDATALAKLALARTGG